MNYYDEDFQPWEIVGGQCVIADESQWQKIDNVVDNYFDKLYLHNPGGAKIGERPKRPVVKLTTDIFEDVTGPVVDSHGCRLVDASSDFPWVSSPSEWMQAHKSIDSQNVLTRVFQTVDLTQHVDYLIVTQRPELVREKWIGCKRDHNKDGDCDRHKNGCPKSNVTLATYVETQSDIERLVPELLKCHDLCKGLAVVCNPKEELDFSDILGIEIDRDGSWRRESKFGGMSQQPVNLIIAEGNEHPIHPDWLRSLRDQCKDANVKFNLASWGQWLHMSQFPTGTNDLVGIETTGPMHSFHAKVGLERSGRLLDGQEHNGRVQ